MSRSRCPARFSPRRSWHGERADAAIRSRAICRPSQDGVGSRLQEPHHRGRGGKHYHVGGGQRFHHHGRLRVVALGQADSVLEGEIIGYSVQSLTYDSKLNSRSYRLTVSMTSVPRF